MIAIPSNIKRFSNAKILKLSNNNISEIAVEAFEGMLNLQVLDLGDNGLTAVETKVFEKLQKLQELSLVGNKLTESDIKKLQESINIPRLYLSDRQSGTVCEGKVANFDKSLMQSEYSDGSSNNSLETEFFVVSSNKFYSLYKDLISSGDMNDDKIENECPICFEELIKKFSSEKLAILVHDDKIPHCFHFSCFCDWFVKDANCPTCRRKVEIGNKLGTKISIEAVFKRGFKDLTKEALEKIVDLVSTLDLSEKMLFFIDKRLPDEVLANIIFNDELYENELFRQSMEDITQIKKEDIQADCFMRHSIRLLKLFENNHEIVDLLVDLIKRKDISSKVTSLDLSDGCLSKQEWSLFMSLFLELKKLEVLDVSNNEIDDVMATQLADVVKTFVNLKSLNVSKNQIRDDGIIALMKAVKSHNKFGSLDASYNDISDYGKVKLALLLKTISIRKHLRLMWNLGCLNGIMNN